MLLSATTTTSVDLDAAAGDSLSVVANILRQDGVDAYDVPLFRARDLASATFASSIREGPHAESDQSATAAFTIAVTDAPMGQIDISLPADHGLAPGVHHYEIDMIDGQERQTIISGKLNVKESLFA